MHRHRLLHLCTLPGWRIPQPEGNAKKSDVTGARIKVEAVVSLQATSALYHASLRKEIVNQEPCASEFVQNVWESRLLVSDLYRVSASAAESRQRSNDWGAQEET